MGIKLFSSDSYCSCEEIKSIDNKFGNPDPKEYIVRHAYEIEGNLVLEIDYPSCTNYEGKKILVYKDITFDELMAKNKQVIDPHFSDNQDYVSPIVRIEPTALGMSIAKDLCLII